MKILQLTTHLRPGGISSYVRTLSEGLRRKGHEVHVAASAVDPLNQAPDAPLIVHRMDVDTKFAWHPKLYLAGRKIEDLIKREQIQLVHAHTRVTQVLASRICKRHTLPLVTTCHGFYKPRLGRRIFPAWGNRVVAISDEVAKHLQGVFHVAPEKIRTILNGVDVESLRNRFLAHAPKKVRARYSLSPEAFVLGMTSRIERVKGHEFLINALAEIKDQYPNVMLLISGTGSDEGRMRALVDQKGLAERVRFCGALEDITEALRAMDVFVSPQTWEEGFGLSAAEAAACGLPLLVAGTGAFRGLFEHEKSAWMVKPASTEALRDGIIRLYQNGPLREKLAEAAGQVAAQKFNLTRMVDEIEELYMELAR